MTDSVSIGGWDKKTRYSLTKGVLSVSRTGGGGSQVTPTTGNRGEGEGDLPHRKLLKKPTLTEGYIS